MKKCDFNKKIGRILSVMLAASLLLVLLAFASSAEGVNHVWQITSGDGSISYSEDPVPFLTPEEGATYRLLADSVSWNRVQTVNSDASYTVDLSGKTVYADPGYNTTPLNLTGAQNVTFLSDGTTFSIATQISVFLNVTGKVRLTVDGGENGFSAYCPCFINAVGSSEVILKNGHLYKNSGNVKALLCARESGSLTVEHCSVYGDELRSPLYLNDKASITLSSSAVIAVGEQGIYCENDNGAQLTLRDHSVLSGTLSGFSSLVAEPGCLLTDVRVSMLKNDVAVRDMVLPQTFAYQKMVDGKIVSATEEIDFNYLISGKGKVTSEKNNDSVWMILDSDRAPSYSDDFYSPFCNAMEDSVFVLLKDTDLPFFPRFSFSRAVGFDFSGRTVRQICDIPTMVVPPLIETPGSGVSVSLNLTGATVLSQSVLLSAPLADKVDVLSADAFVFSPVFFLCPAAGLTIQGGYFDGGNEINCGIHAGGLTADHTRIVFDSEEKQACKTVGNATLSDVHIYAPNYGGALCVGNTLALDNKSPIYGSVTASSLIVGVGNLFAGNIKAEESMSVLISDQVTPYSLLTFSYDGGKVKPSVSSIAFTKVTASPLRGIKASFHFGPEVLLHLYVPESTIRFASDFSIRISVNGILYETSSVSGIMKEIDGEEYEMFTYRYLYHDQALSTAHCALVLGGISSSFDVPLLQLFEESLEQASADVKPVIANYLAYTFYVSEAESAHELLTPYLDLITSEKAELVEDDSISEIIRAVAFDPRKCTLEFAFSENFKKSLALSYKYDGKKQILHVDGSEVDTFDIMIYRVRPTDTFTFSYEAEGETKEIAVSLLTFAALSDDTLSAEDLDRYISYLSVLGEHR